MVQAGLSTALCMCSQLWAPLAAFHVLLKTVLLVVACGLLHGRPGMCESASKKHFLIGSEYF
jgi:hypothetical protein